MAKVYVYPNVSLDNKRQFNPYISDLMESLSIDNLVVNRDNPTTKGIFDLLRYLPGLDVVYLNWVEDLPDKRGGKIQSLAFLIMLVFLKISGIKIVWTLHNKSSHSSKSRRLKNALLNLMRSKSDVVITHASEGLRFIPDKTNKVYIPHPIKEALLDSPVDTKHYDIIIWGAVTRYKGIDAFLHYLIEKKLIHKYQILIAGKVAGPDLTEQLMKLVQDHHNIGLENRFIPEDELGELIRESKLILFCYHSESVLSSGSLVESLRYKSTVVGPDVGAFRDLSQDGLIYTFRDFDHLVRELDSLLSNYVSRGIPKNRIEKYIQENSWEKFAEKLKKQLMLFFPEAK